MILDPAYLHEVLKAFAFALGLIGGLLVGVIGDGPSCLVWLGFGLHCLPCTPASRPTATWAAFMEASDAAVRSVRHSLHLPPSLLCLLCGGDLWIYREVFQAFWWGFGFSLWPRSSRNLPS